MSDLEEAIRFLSPSSEWSLSGDTLSGLVWLDKVKPRPTDAQILSAIATVRTNDSQRKVLKQQSLLDVKNAVLTVQQRFQALLTLLDFDL